MLKVDRPIGHVSPPHMLDICPTSDAQFQQEYHNVVDPMSLSDESIQELEDIVDLQNGQ